MLNVNLYVHFYEAINIVQSVDLITKLNVNYENEIEDELPNEIVVYFICIDVVERCKHRDAMNG